MSCSLSAKITESVTFEHEKFHLLAQQPTLTTSAGLHNLPKICAACSAPQSCEQCLAQRVTPSLDFFFERGKGSTRASTADLSAQDKCDGEAAALCQLLAPRASISRRQSAFFSAFCDWSKVKKCFEN